MKRFVLCLLTLFSTVLLVAYLYLDTQSLKEQNFSQLEQQQLTRALLNIELRTSNDNIALHSPKQRLGKLLFDDVGLSKENNVSCATCHVPQANFQDVNNMSEKLRSSSIRAMSLRGAREQDWYFWDGRADSLWAQVLDALSNDHGLSNPDIIEYACSTYSETYPVEFSFCNNDKYSEQNLVEIGRIIAAYVSKIEHYWTRFDEFAYRFLYQNETSDNILSPDEIEGMKLFLDSKKTGCIDCHSGRRFTNGGFYAIGTGSDVKNDRIEGARQYQNTPYQCERWESKDRCQVYQYAKLEGSELKGAFKVPSLRNLKRSPAFMHDGRFKSLEEVIDFYMNPYSYPLTHTDVQPLRLMPHQREQLILFLKALNDEYY